MKHKTDDSRKDSDTEYLINYG